MQTFFLVVLFLFWLLFWSFSSVIIYRIKSKEWGILTGRSHCAICQKTLKAIDLIPLFSWLVNLWKCRYCKTKISKLYPILELSTWILFALVGYFLIDYNLIFLWDYKEIIKLIFWLAVAFISIIYVFYDILFFEISEKVLFSWVFLALFWVIIQTYTSIDIFSNLSSWNDLSLLEKNFSILLLIAVIFWLYVIILKNLAEIFDIIILIFLFFLIYLFNWFFAINTSLAYFPAVSSVIAVISIFTFFFLQILISGWKWMWWWDLRIAIFIWILLGSYLVLPAMMITYFVGSIIGIAFLIYQKIKNSKKEIQTQIPFGPFLAIWFFITIFFQKEILNFISIYF